MHMLMAACVAVLTLGLLSAPARAVCSLPGGAAGEIIYNSSEKLMQYCDDTDWIAMHTPGSGGCDGGAGWAFHPSAEANNWSGVTYGGGIFLAVASNGTNRVMTSTDGISWVPRAEANQAFLAVAYGNGVFVAVSASGTVRRSVDGGATWTSHAATSNDNWRGVAYGNGRFIAVAASGTNRMMTSTDGTSWTVVPGIEQNFWNDVQYLNGRFVAVAASGTNRVATSPDGVTWAPISIAASSWYSVTYGNGVYVVVNDGGGVRYSSDAVTWNLAAGVPAGNWKTVTFGNGTFVAAAWGGTNRLMVSTNGMNWTAVTLPQTHAWGDVTFGNGAFVAVNESAGADVLRSTCGAGCSNPERAEGAMIFNAAHNVMQVCAGSQWQAMSTMPSADDGGSINWSSASLGLTVANPTGAWWDWFGNGVAISGTTVAAGTHLSDTPNESGRVYIMDGLTGAVS
ncbi:MAG: hypothetical protein KJ667_07430, partial [Alphaproteobacteria bacterium]|nr:hypothetical protein [Alphaproteobacteria bacterium]